MNNHNQTNHPYSKFSNDELILRDELAVDRTLLANERTLLAYLRSAVSLALAGVSIMHFSEQQWFWIIGLICIPGGIGSGDHRHPAPSAHEWHDWLFTARTRRVITRFAG